jgi:hypothetical protein
VSEVGEPHRPYRRASLQPLASLGPETELSDQRARLARMFTSDVFAASGLGGQFRQMLDAMPLGEVADLIAFNFFPDVLLKQSLLAECDVRRRVARVIEELDAMRPLIRPAKSGLPRPSEN